LRSSSGEKPKGEVLLAVKGPVDDLTVPRALSGDPAKGERLFRMGCGLCHGSTARAVSPGRFSARQWSTFFARAVHGRHDRLRPHFTRAELADIKAYLISAQEDR
jgi:mono/diheme cytochrome c family protein